MIQMFAALAAQAIKTGMDGSAARRQQSIQNDSIKAFNKAVIASNAKAMNEINIQRTASRAQTAQALEASKRQAMQAKSDRGLQAAAADTMGSSVDAGLQEIDVQLQQATGTLMQNQELQELSFNSAVQRQTDTAMGQLQDLKYGAGDDAQAAFLGSAIGMIGTSMIANKLSGKTVMGEKKGAPISAAKGTRTPSQQGWANFFGL